MNIQKPNGLIWKGQLTPLNLSKVDSIALHHMAHPTAGILEVQSWHIEKGWLGIGYNYWIDFNGNVYECRGLNEGAGVLGHNGHVISIGFQGDYDKASLMPDAQFRAGVDIINYLRGIVPTITTVAGHKYLGGTECPGKYFPLDAMINGGDDMLLKRGSVGSAVMELQEKLNDYGFQLFVDGDFGSGTESAVKSFQKKVGLSPDGIAGPMTMDALNIELNTPNPNPVIHHWAQPFYDFLKSKEIDLKETRFDDSITRGEVFKLMAYAMGYKE